MNLDKRLRSAANELNQSARNSSPPPLRSAGERMRPWMAFAAAFAVVLAVFGIPYVLGNFGGSAPSDAGPLASSESTTTTECIVPDSTTTVVSTEGDPHVIAFLNDEDTDGVPPGAHAELVAEVESWTEVGSVVYFDKEHTWIEYQQFFEGDDELLDIDPSILPATIRIELTDFDSRESIRQLLEARAPVVRSVEIAPADANPIANWFGESVPELAEESTDVIGCGDPAESTTTTTGVESTTAGSTCAAGESGPPTTLAYSDDGSDPRDLTEAVREQLTAVAEAAAACNATGLAALAADDITTTFGPDGGPADIASWPADDERFGLITELFKMSHGVTEMPDGSTLYVWPAAFAYDTWEEIPDLAMEELLRIYTQEELDQIAQLGSYGGWRIGITESGEWIFFVAGD